MSHDIAHCPQNRFGNVTVTRLVIFNFTISYTCNVTAWFCGKGYFLVITCHCTPTTPKIYHKKSYDKSVLTQMAFIPYKSSFTKS